LYRPTVDSGQSRTRPGRSSPRGRRGRSRSPLEPRPPARRGAPAGGA
jgi:hypothetical protein